jgi:folate-binding protein YgfZ
LFDFLVWADRADLLIDCEAAQADGLIRRLMLYRLRRPIVIARDETLAVHWALEGDQGVPDPRLPALGRRWIAPADDAAEGWRAHRLALGVTEGVAELGTDKTLWLETNAAELNGVSFSKGCYVGQENTARMNWRQKVNRRLVVMRTPENPGEPANIYYPDLGLAVLRVSAERLGAGADPVKQEWFIRPDWLNAALAQSGEM